MLCIAGEKNFSRSDYTNRKSFNHRITRGILHTCVRTSKAGFVSVKSVFRTKVVRIVVCNLVRLAILMQPT